MPRHRETHNGVAGVAFRLPDGNYTRELDVEVGSIAKSMQTSIGRSPTALMGLPGESDDPDLSRRREWGVWAPESLAPQFEEALQHGGHDIVHD